MSCLPKAYLCGTYIPNFTPGPTPCTLQSNAERRARLVAGGAFFRSVVFGVQNIYITSEWLDSGNNVTTIFANMTQVRLTFTEGTTVETHTVPQIVYAVTGVDNVTSPNTFTFAGDVTASFPVSGTFYITGSANNNGTYTVGLSGASYLGGFTTVPVVQSIPSGTVDGYANLTNSIGSLRTAVASSTLVTMPTTDGIEPWNSSTQDPGYLNYFSATLMTGAYPPAPSVALRTGPIYTLVYITGSEDASGNPITDPTYTPTVKYWNSVAWVAFDPLSDCYDPITNPPTCP